MGKNYTGPPFLVAGVMSGTSSIFSRVIDLAFFDKGYIQVAYVGTGTGTISVYGSNDGVTFDAVTFNPVLTQPAGSSGGYGIELAEIPGRYVMLGYVNASGTGVLNATLFARDLS